MKRLLLPLLALCLVASCEKESIDVTGSSENKEEEKVDGVDHSVVQGESIVRFSDEMISLIEDDLNQGKVATRSMGLNQALDELGISSITRLFPDAGEYEIRSRREGMHKWYIVKYNEDVAQTRAAAELGSVPGVEYVEERRKVETDGFNDPDYSRQWGYYNSSKPGYDINVVPVWGGYTTGSPNVVVAVIDEGVDVSHPDLAANCYSKHYNSFSGSGTVVAGEHGTHVAGTIAAVNNNGVGVSGVAGGDAAKGVRGVSIMSCEILRATRTGTSNGNTPNAIKWAADNGAVICQNSWGYSYDYDGDGKYNSAELNAALKGTIMSSDKAAIDYFIKYAGCDNYGNQLADSPMKGGLVVFAAGNENIQNGVPANYEPIVAVAAIDANGSKASYSNYGSFVDIAAPGSSVYSTLPNNKYGSMSGTSMACPHVSGVAALLVSYFGGPGFTCDQLKERLLNSKNTSKVPSNIAGLVDALAAFNYGGDYVPEKVTDVDMGVRSNTLSLSWKVTGDDEKHPAYAYAVMYGKDRSAVESASPSAATLTGVSREIVTPNLGLGETFSMSLKDLDFNSTYYVKVVGRSYAGTYGESSPVMTIVTKENNPPVIEFAEEELVLKPFGEKDIEISFSEPDGHEFTYSYKQGSDADVFGGLTDSTALVKITASRADAGTYTAEITAVDKYGATTVKKLTYTVLENNPPQMVKKVEDMFFTKLGSEFTLDMPEYFEDPDGESLKFETSMSNSSVAYLTTSADKMIGTILRYGATTVTIKALDAKKASAEVTFNILAREPSVEYVAYPNPVKDVLRLATGKDLEKVDIKLVSQSGAVVFDESMDASAFEPAVIDMSGMAPGRYQATFRFGGKEYKENIVKK